MNQSASNQPFSIKEVLTLAWGKFTENLGLLLAVVFVAWLASAIPSWIAGRLWDHVAVLAIVFNIAQIVIQLLVTLGLIHISLDLIDKKKTQFTNLFSYSNQMLSLFLGNLAWALIIVVGLVLLIFPAFIWGVRFSFFAFFIADKKLDPIESLKASAKLTEGVRWELFFFYLVLLVLNLLGALLLGIGLLVTIPISLLAHAWLYRNLPRLKAKGAAAA